MNHNFAFLLLILLVSNRIKKATPMELTAIISSEISEIRPEITMVTKKMVITHRTVLLRTFFDAAGSDLDTTCIPLSLFK